MLSRFTVTMCVAMVALAGKWRFLPGRPRDLWHSVSRLSVCFLGATNVVVSAIATAWEFGRGFCSWGWVSSCR